MLLVERHAIKRTHPIFKEIDNLSFQSKNLYNTALYIIKSHYKTTGEYIQFNNLYHELKKYPIWNDCKLPKKVCNQLVKLVDQNFKAFFQAHKAYKANPTNFNSVPRVPNYKDSIKGRCMLIYEKQALMKLVFRRTKKIQLSGTSFQIQTKIPDIKLILQVSIVPKNNYYIIEITYEKEEKQLKQNKNIASVDLGVNNLATVAFNDCKRPFIINGKPLKSINQFYNKKQSLFKSKLNKNCYNSNKLISLTNKRNNKISDYLHKASRLLVNQLVSRDVSKLIIGYNQNWKQDINIGKVNNQNFTSIPFFKFITMLEYKCKIEGIEVIKHEESYTSKCSFLDMEPIKKHEKYVGKRIKRGMFSSSSGKCLNSDLNGAYNILRKAVPNSFEGIEGIAVCPRLFTI